MKEKDILRIIDANMNRLREALRVCEDIARFVMEERALTSRLKNLRHSVTAALAGSKKVKYAALISSRDVENDVGRASSHSELRRRDAADLLAANLERAKESVRVLEEFSKVFDRAMALRFKKERFKLYDIERALVEKL
jgi:thiamine-phosphate pyrophosphorylase